MSGYPSGGGEGHVIKPPIAQDSCALLTFITSLASPNSNE